MKTISYRGGLITFQIPKDWLEEYKENGGAVFYEDTPESGTLRVNILTIKEKDNSESDHSIVDSLKSLYNSNELAESLVEYDSIRGDKIIESISRTQENQTPISIYKFDCIHKTEQLDYLLAIFTWTIESKFENLDKYTEDLKIIRNNLKHLYFGR